MPAWVDAEVDAYLRRLPPDWRIELKSVRPVTRSANEKDPTTAMEREADRLRALMPPRAHVVALDERGSAPDSRQLSAKMQQWRELGTPVVLIIGGADGIAPSLMERAAERLRLSNLTLPHAMVRVLLAEQLYRGWSMLAGHPYHRD